MTKEQQNRFTILFALKNLSNISTKNEFLSYILENQLIILEEKDFKILSTRREEKWRNELAFVRSHLVKEGFLSNLSRNKWEIPLKGDEYYSILLNQLEKELAPIRINKIEIQNYNSENRYLVNEERENYKVTHYF